MMLAPQLSCFTCIAANLQGPQLARGERGILQGNILRDLKGGLTGYELRIIVLIS
jgi:hypothetical protein